MQKETRWARHHLEYRETIVTILCPPGMAAYGWQAIQKARLQLEGYIKNNPEFKTSHVPLSLSEDMPEVAGYMAEAASRVGVGPMAAVAGTLARVGVESIVNAGASEAIVDNGGDIAFYLKEPVTVGIYAGNQFKSLAFKVAPRDGVFGICTSSGTIGPSYSYGQSDAAIVISENLALADAAATALGNRIQSEKDLENAFRFMQEVDAIEGAAVVLKDKIALWGSLPEIIPSTIDMDLITKGQMA